LALNLLLVVLLWLLVLLVCCSAPSSLHTLLKSEAFSRGMAMEHQHFVRGGLEPERKIMSRKKKLASQIRFF
jgi:hypothetical protein